MYLMVCSRPNLAYAVSVVSKFMANLGQEHLEALKWILRYVKGLTKIGLAYRAIKDISRPIISYDDLNFAGNLDTRKSLTSYVFALYGTAIS